MARRLVTRGLISLVVALCAAPAAAAFPGGNGKLVVAGQGKLELVNPLNGAATPLCADRLECGVPAHPSVSPNGRAIAFVDATTSRLVVIGPDGTCLWCLLGPRPTSLTGRAPAFTPNGAAVTLAGSGLRQVSLAGSPARTIVNRTGRRELS